MRIEDNEAHLWYGQADTVSAPDLLRRYMEILSDEEQEALERHRFSRDRHAELVRRVMVRYLLSRYVAVEPSCWRFRTNNYGRPEIAEPHLGDVLRFSVSHTEGLIVVLISKRRGVGVDVERLPCAGCYMQIANDFFSPAEASHLGSLDPSTRALRFLQLWTLKESYLKARGVGLTAPLDQVSFAIEPSPTRRIEFHVDASLEDDPRRWQFDLEGVGEEYIVATAVERSRDERVLLLTREAPCMTAPPELREQVGPASIAKHS